MIQSCKTETY